MPFVACLNFKRKFKKKGFEMNDLPSVVKNMNQRVLRFDIDPGSNVVFSRQYFCRKIIVPLSLLCRQLGEKTE